MNGSQTASLNLVLDVGKVFCLLLVSSMQFGLVCFVYLLNLIKNCGWSGEDYETELPQAMQGGNKSREAYPWMEHMRFNLCSQVH